MVEKVFDTITNGKIFKVGGGDTRKTLPIVSHVTLNQISPWVSFTSDPSGRILPLLTRLLIFLIIFFSFNFYA